MISPQAIISASAEIGQNVAIGSFSIIEDNAILGDGCQIGSHSIIRRHSQLGVNNRVAEHSVIGGDPQSIHYEGEPTTLVIGDNNTIGEFVTISRGTAQGGGTTTVGSGNVIMAYCHIAHDCVIADYCTFVNGTNIAGHTVVGEFAFIGGFTMIHQHCRIGSLCMTGINTVLRKDVAPFVTVNGNPATAISLNSVGLRRRNFDEETRAALRKVFGLYFRQRKSAKELESLLDRKTAENTRVKQLIEFLLSTQRGVVR